MICSGHYASFHPPEEREAEARLRTGVKNPSQSLRDASLDHLVGAGKQRRRKGRSSGRSERSNRIALRIELYIWLKHARAWDKVCVQTDAVGVLEQHRIVTRCPCPLLRAVDYDGPHLSNRSCMRSTSSRERARRQRWCKPTRLCRKRSPLCAGPAGWMPIAVRAPTQ